MKTYIYNGPLAGVTLDDGREIMLFNGKPYELPENNTYVKTLVKLKRLKEGKAPTAKKKSKKKTTTTEKKEN